VSEIVTSKLIKECKKNTSFINDQKYIFFYSQFFWIILVIKCIATLAAFFIYSKFTPFVDTSLYLSSCTSYCFGGWSFHTSLTHLLYFSIKKVLVSDLMVNIFVSLSLTYVLWKIFIRSYYFLNKYLFYSSLLLPHFLIWSGMVSKDAILIAGYFLIVRACVDLTVRKHTQIMPLLIGIILPLLIRPHYMIAYGFLLLTTLFFINFEFKFLDKPKQSFIVLFLSLVFVFILILFYWNNLSIYLLKLMYIIKNDYFMSQASARANRLDIVWNNASDLLFNLWWGLPISLIGPTLHEVFLRPIMLPAFLEGLFSLILFVYIMVKINKFALSNSKYNEFIILGLIPSVLIGLLINYPMGIFNPGSAIRYKQSLAPLFYFYPLLLMSEIKMKEALNR
jgi:hypothetical protein